MASSWFDGHILTAIIIKWFFVAHPGRVFSRNGAVWGYGHDGYEHTVNSHINRLRAKLRSRGTGYIHNCQ